jgi:peptidoglycan/xylan/chitin deacetylase (PgdA/CDA1 family)
VVPKRTRPIRRLVAGVGILRAVVRREQGGGAVVRRRRERAATMTQPASGKGLLRDIRAAAAPAAKRLLMRGGVYGALRRLRPSRKVAILRYHAVCQPEAGYADPGICVTPAGFEQQVQYLAGNYAVLPLPLVVDSLVCRRPLPDNTVAITFDDGYADNLEAARVLRRYGCSATFYITAGCMAGDLPFWPAELRALVAALPGPVLRLTAGRTALELPVASPGDRKAAVRRLTRLFKSNPIPVREALREELRAAAGRPDVPSVMLTWDQVREMHRLGMTIGGHTMTHPNLPSAGLAAASDEITRCRERLERELDDDPVTMFSYPNGGADLYFTPELQKVVRAAGYAAAATSRNGFAGPGSDVYALERVQVAERLDDLVFALEVERFAFKPRSRSAEVG